MPEPDAVDVELREMIDEEEWLDAASKRVTQRVAEATGIPIWAFGLPQEPETP